MRHDGLDLYAIANVFLLSRTAARAFRRGIIPGIVVTDELLALAERHGASADKGRSFFVELAAKHVAVARGLGFDGVYLGGHMSAETFGQILDQADAFADGWQEAAREIQFPRRGGVLLLRAGPGHGALLGRGEQVVPRSRGERGGRRCACRSSTA